jgi:GNAT superfamily N-acetyltransferase
MTRKIIPDFQKNMSLILPGHSPAARVLMIRCPLSGFLPCSPPPGFKVRMYQTGDEGHWLKIHREAEESIKMSPSFFQQQFGADSHLLRLRQLYILSPEGTPVGTSTAWFGGHSRDDDWGRVHWVAIQPDFQRRGLASALISATCARLEALGHSKAYLVTWSDRPWAIRLYERFGFVRQSQDAQGS